MAPETVSRRVLLHRAASAAAGISLGATLMGGHSGAAAQTAPETEKRPRLRGVNLGGWLVLEKWITPRVFEGVKAGDEYGLCTEMGQEAARKRLNAHRKSFIRESDFAWMAKAGLNAVRIPVGYWALGGEMPFVDCRDTLDQAFRWAKRHGLRVVLDLHGAPGSQNGFDHSGKAGPIEWTEPDNIARTLDVVELLAARYGKEEALFGLELLNEPSWDVPLAPLKQYYRDGYARVRKYLPKERVAVVIHDGFRPMEWAGFMGEPEYSNVILDTHLYQCFTDDDKRRSAAQHIESAAVGWSGQIDAMQAQLWTTVGEWSLALNGEVFAGLLPLAQEAVKRAYASSQLLAFEKAQGGWFFWTYKTENAPEWSFRESVRRGWLPSPLT